MAKLTGTTILDTIVPPADTSKFATHDSQYGKGGWKEFANWTAVRNMPRERMRQGMAVNVVGDGIYTLDIMGSTVEGDVWSPITAPAGPPGPQGPAGSIDNFQVLSQSEFDSIPEIQTNIIYCVYEDGSSGGADPVIDGDMLELNGALDSTVLEVAGEIEDNILTL